MADYYAHPTAVLDPPVAVGDGTKIWHFCHVMAGAVIGRQCVLSQNVFVASSAKLGRNVRVQNNVSIYDGVEIEDDVFLGPSCVFTNVVYPRAEIDRRGKFAPTRIGRGATIGANATVVCGEGLTIGRYAFVGAGAVVTRDVADYELVIGAPARSAGWAGRHGVPLRQTDERRFECPASGLRYALCASGSLSCVDLDEDAPLGVALGGRGKDSP